MIFGSQHFLSVSAKTQPPQIGQAGQAANEAPLPDSRLDLIEQRIVALENAAFNDGLALYNRVKAVAEHLGLDIEDLIKRV